MANLLLVRPAKEKYGPIYFNSTKINFALTNHPPEDLDAADSRVVEYKMQGTQRIVAFMKIQSLQRYCPAGWVQRKCALGKRYGACTADISVNYEDCRGTALYKKWRGFCVMTQYVLFPFAATELLILLALRLAMPPECRYRRCCGVQCGPTHPSSRTRQRDSTTPHYTQRDNPPSQSSEQDNTPPQSSQRSDSLGSNYQYFFSSNIRHGANRLHRQSKGNGTKNPGHSKQKHDQPRRSRDKNQNELRIPIPTTAGDIAEKG
jgi:hypothetical protein